MDYYEANAFFTEFNTQNLFTEVVEMKRPSFIGSSRFVLTILCNLGVFQMMILRFNVSMAIVCMTKNDTMNGTIHNTTINDKTVSLQKLTTPYSILQTYKQKLARDNSSYIYSPVTENSTGVRKHKD